MDDPTPERGDAFGRALRAHHDGEDAMEHVERDDSWLEANDIATYFAPPDAWPARQRAALDRLAGERVLDVGCGAGRAALALQERGHEVTAVDVSPGALSVARRRGVTDARERDVAELSRLDGYGAAVLFGNNFGLVGTADRASAVLGELTAATGDDAVVLAESTDPVATDDPAHLAYHELNRERDRLPGALRIRVRYGRTATPWYDYLLASPETMRELVAPTAWRLAEVIDGEGPAYVGVLRKQA